MNTEETFVSTAWTAARETEVVLELTPEGLIQSAAGDTERLLSCGPERLTGTSLFRHVIDEDLLYVFKQVGAVALGDEQQVTLGFHMRSPGGGWRAVLARATGRMEAGTTLGIILALHLATAAADLSQIVF